MNILTAPLALVADTFTPKMGIAPQERDPAQLFLAVATLLTIGLVIAGVWMIAAGKPGDIAIALGDLKIETKTGGIALAALGLAFYLAIGKMVLDRPR